MSNFNPLDQIQTAAQRSEAGKAQFAANVAKHEQIIKQATTTGRWPTPLSHFTYAETDGANCPQDELFDRMAFNKALSNMNKAQAAVKAHK